MEPEGSLPLSQEPATSSYFEPEHSSSWPPHILKILLNIIILSTLFSNTLSLLSCLVLSNQDSHPYKTTGNIILMYILMLIYLGIKLQDKMFCTK
jgi:hypothetical protein